MIRHFIYFLSFVVGFVFFGLVLPCWDDPVQLVGYWNTRTNVSLVLGGHCCVCNGVTVTSSVSSVGRKLRWCFAPLVWKDHCLTLLLYSCNFFQLWLKKNIFFTLKKKIQFLSNCQTEVTSLQWPGVEDEAQCRLCCDLLREWKQSCYSALPEQWDVHTVQHLTYCMAFGVIPSCHTFPQPHIIFGAVLLYSTQLQGCRDTPTPPLHLQTVLKTHPRRRIQDCGQASQSSSTVATARLKSVLPEITCLS